MPINFDDNVNQILGEALFYESLGWSVIPVKSHSKEPAVAWTKYQSQRADETQIRAWFEKPNYNVGIITGDVSKHLLVIDMDLKEGLSGDDTLAELCMEHSGTIPETVECHTGGGGRHLFFHYPPGASIPNSRGSITEGLGLGIDVRGNGGYVVAAPSTHSNGRNYSWSTDNNPHDVEIANVPTWLLNLVRERRDREQMNSIRKVVDNTGEFDAFGQRIDFREKRATELTMAVFFGLQKSLNRIPTVEEIFTDVSKTYFNETKGSKAELEIEQRGETMLWGKAEYILKRHYRGSLPESVSAVLEVEDTEPEPGSKAISELSTEPKPREWIVDSLVPANEVTSLYGDGGIGKSLLAQQLATAVSLGKPFLLKDTMQAPSLYISCEDDWDELQRRQFAINQSYGLLVGNAINGRLWSRTGFDNIMVTWPMSGQATIMPFVDRIMSEIELHQIKLLVLDNISDLFSGNENDRSQVNYFAKAVLGKIIRRCNVTIVLLGHPPKNPDADYSGSTAWNASVRARHQLKKPFEGMDDERQLVCKKSNYSDATDLKIDLVWQKGVFVVPELYDDDTVSSINYRNTCRTLLEKIGTAWDEGRPYSARRDHPRCLDRLMMDSVSSREDRDAMRRALRDAKNDEWIETGRTGQKRGYRIAMPPKWLA